MKFLACLLTLSAQTERVIDVYRGLYTKMMFTKIVDIMVTGHERNNATENTVLAIMG